MLESHAGGADLNLPDSGTGQIDSTGGSNPFNQLVFRNIGASSELWLHFQTDVTGAPLSTLSGLPNTPSAIIAFLAGSSPHADGIFFAGSFGSVTFNTAFDTVPIPAALPLFASALGGLGFLTWRRRATH